MRSVVLVVAVASLVVLVLWAAHTPEIEAASVELHDGLVFAGDASGPFSGRVIEGCDHGQVKSRQSFFGTAIWSLIRSGSAGSATPGSWLAFLHVVGGPVVTHGHCGTGIPRVT